jgi:hypothetical protein
MTEPARPYEHLDSSVLLSIYTQACLGFGRCRDGTTITMSAVTAATAKADAETMQEIGAEVLRRMSR